MTAAATAFSLIADTMVVHLERRWLPPRTLRVAEGDVVPVHLVARSPTLELDYRSRRASRESTEGLSAEDRRTIVQAAIVRTLKKAGKMSHVRRTPTRRRRTRSIGPRSRTICRWRLRD